MGVSSTAEKVAGTRIGQVMAAVKARIAITGLCMGGGSALGLVKSSLFRVSAPFRGRTPAGLDGAYPVVSRFGGRYPMTGPDVERLKQGIARRDIKTYP